MKYILTSDWHLRADKPRCRLDENWEQTQIKILDFIFDKSAEYKADIIHTGDLFDQPQVPDWVKYMFLDRLNRTRYDGFNPKMYLLAGNHEMPYHNFKNINKSSIGVVFKSRNIKSLNELGQAIHYGLSLKYDLRTCNKIFIHKLTYKNSVPPYIKNAITAQELLNIFNKSKWIITGDNHKRFIYENNNRYVINPGCIMRQTIDEINYDPSFYLIDFETEEIETIKIPDNIEMVTDEYIIDDKKRDDRIQSFIELIRKDSKLALSFKDVLIRKLNESNEELDYFKDMIYELMEDVYNE